MKIYINRCPKTGPWGGGIKTVNKLVAELEESGYEVVYRLGANIDIIFCVDPRPNKFGERYQQLLNYKEQFGAKIIQRVGDLGTQGKPELTGLVKQTLSYSDFLIFPSEWAKEYIGFEGKNYKVIHNGALDVFHKNKKINTKLPEKINLITHHWSTNPKKGFETYLWLEKFIESELSNYSFTYIGRVPKGVMFKNYFEPLDATELSKVLPEYNIYITASLEEAGANHVLEAMAAGLPVIYHKKGGSINNYCGQSGVGYETNDGLLDAISKVVENYKLYKIRVLSYNRTIDDVIEEYKEIICNIK